MADALFQFLLILLFVFVHAEPPKIDPFSFNQKYPSLGSRIIATCSVSVGSMPMTLSWMFNNRSISGDRLKRFISFQDYSSTLAIVNFNIEDFGAYTCIARNKFGVDSYTSVINVDVSPLWVREPVDDDVLVRKQGSFSCIAKGFPKLRFVWIRCKSNFGSGISLNGPLSALFLLLT